MTTTPMTAAEIRHLIHQATDVLERQGLSDQSLEVVLEVLLWARWLPTSEGPLVGYFDALHPLSGAEEWLAIREAISRRSGVPAADLPQAAILKIESLRGILLPLGQLLNRGEPQLVRLLIATLLSMRGEARSVELSLGMGQLWDELLTAHPAEPVACLYPLGTAVAPLLAMARPVVVQIADEWQQPWLLGLLSLYPNAVQPALVAKTPTWPVAIVSPPWNQRLRELLQDDPWLPPAPLDCPDAIREADARRLYAAHQRCTGTTYALVPPGLGFGTARGLDYFREELVRRNWLDAVVSLPMGVLGAGSLGGLLLVLRHDREPGAPIHIVDAGPLLEPRFIRPRQYEWRPERLQELVQWLRERRESSCARLVSVEELETNAFILQVHRYLFSEADLSLQRYLDSRQTIQLGDLAELCRPAGILGRQSEEGVEVGEVLPTDMDDAGQVLQASRTIRLPDDVLAKSRQYLLEPGDVLLSIKGGLGKAGVVQALDRPTLPGQSFCVVRLRPNAPITPAALVQYLRSVVGRHLLSRAAQGTTVAFVPMGDLKSLPVVLPTEDEAQRACALEQEQVEQVTVLRTIRQTLEATTTQGWLSDLPPDLTLTTDRVN